MVVVTPQLQLQTLVALDGRGRIVATREPVPSRGPAFLLIRGPAGVAWAIRGDIDEEVSAEIDDLAARESSLGAWDRPPVHADRYRALLGGRLNWGPAFEFPEALVASRDVVEVREERVLITHFPGWVDGEIEAGASPVRAILEYGIAVSVCACARSSPVAAEAGLDTAEGRRGRGYAPIVAAAWAVAVRGSGRVPLYSTDWSNAASLAVARTLDLRIYATDWSLGG